MLKLCMPLARMPRKTLKNLCEGGMSVKLRREQITKALDALMECGKVLVPSAEDGAEKFVPYKPGVKFDFEQVNTILPPKDALFPQTQKMYRFKTGQDAEIEEMVEADEQIIFGMRPCDVQSIVCLDEVFLTKTYVDNFYARKRDKLTVIAIACTASNPTCFCESMGVDPASSPAADVLLIPTEEGWNVHSQTPKGQAIIEGISATLEDGEATPIPAAKPGLSVNMEGIAQKLAGMFDHPVWDEIYRPCLNCGICTFMCPTCYCFEIAPENRGSEGIANRHWDSCMFSEYTRMAGGHNPRPTGKERVRNRYMHKLTYFAERYGMGLCVGCGRCIAKCPVGMDITKIIEFAGEVEAV